MYSLQYRVSKINKDVRGIIDRIVWKLKLKHVIQEYDYKTCVFVPTISNKNFCGCRSIGYNRRQINYRILRQFMRDPDIFIRSVRVKDIRRVNDFTPDKILAHIPTNYAYTSTTFLRDLRKFLRNK